MGSRSSRHRRFLNGLTALLALELAALPPAAIFAVTGGAGLLAHYAIAAAKRKGLVVIADAKAEEIDLVRSYGATVVVERSDDFAGAVRREHPEGVDALLDIVLLAEKSFGAIKDGGIYLPVRGWNDKLRVAGQFPPEQVGEAQRMLAGGLRGRPVVPF
ncbi:hypothetical protein [Rhizobium leguminosarum]|uniref:hypothetical protein n=1 Tax=Rhizobium leguminosarum TaxID=384 RepID=UPI0019D4385A|nr:hypothetical protein [Rhizobium leguminosarum]